MAEILDWDPVYKAYYIDKRTNASILEQFDLPVQQALYKCFPPYVHSELKCEFCGEALISRFLNKTEKQSQLRLEQNLRDLKPIRVENPAPRYNYSYSRCLPSRGNAFKTDEGYLVSKPNCPKCNHSPSKNCECIGCLDLKAKYQLMISEQLKAENLVADIPKRNFSDLSGHELLAGLLALTYGKFEEKRVHLSAVEPDDKKVLLASGLFIHDSASFDKCVTMKSTVEYSIDNNAVTYVVNSTNTCLPSDAISKLKLQAMKKTLDPDERLDVLTLWGELALDEAMQLLKHYCGVYNLQYQPGEKTISSIKRSLRKYGLAQTARYIYNAVKRSQNYALEKGYDRRRAFNLVRGNLDFWIDDIRTKDWSTPPFNRGSDILCETKKTIVFSHSFLEAHDVDYFTAPINLKELATL